MSEKSKSSNHLYPVARTSNAQSDSDGTRRVDDGTQIIVDFSNNPELRKAVDSEVLIPEFDPTVVENSNKD